MLAKDLGNLAFKIFGIYFIVQGLIALSHLAVFSVSNDPNSWLWLTVAALAPIIVPVVAGLLLLVFSQPLSQKLFGSIKSPVSWNITIEQLQAVAFSVVGVFVLALSAPRLVNLAVYYALVPSETHMPAERTAITYSQIAALILQFIIGLGLLFGSKGVVGLLRYFRQLGAK